MATKLKYFLVLLYFLVVAATLALGSGYGFYIFGHLLVFGGWIFVIRRFRLNSKHSMKSALFFFVMGVILNIVSLKEFGEEVMRIFFILFSIGLIQAFAEFKRNVKTY